MKRGIFIESIESDELRETLREVIREELAGAISAPVNQSNTLLTRQEAAQMLGVTVQTIDRYVATGKLLKRKIGGKVFFSGDDIQAALQ